MQPVATLNLEVAALGHDTRSLAQGIAERFSHGSTDGIGLAIKRALQSPDDGALDDQLELRGHIDDLGQ